MIPSRVTSKVIATNPPRRQTLKRPHVPLSGRTCRSPADRTSSTSHPHRGQMSLGSLPPTLSGKDAPQPPPRIGLRASTHAPQPRRTRVRGYVPSSSWQERGIFEVLPISNALGRKAAATHSAATTRGVLGLARSDSCSGAAVDVVPSMRPMSSPKWAPTRVERIVVR
jgi:hypothetical protein